MADAASKASAEPTAPKPHKAPTLEEKVTWIDDWMESSQEARQASAMYERYYNGEQWSTQDLAELKKRGQPPIVDNLIRRKVNTIRGEEIEKRVDPVVRPRTPQNEDEANAANAYTDALRFVEEDQEVDEVGGDSLLDLLAPGYCGAIVQVDPEDGYRVTVDGVPWTQIAVDPHSRKRVANDDAKWIANIQWFDLEDAVETYPDAEEALKSGVDRHIGATDDTTEDRPKKWFDGKRKRVKICEMYYRSGKDWYRCDFTQGATLRESEPSPYLDPRTGRPWCPIVVVRCYLDDDNMPHGIVRDMISPQDEINKRKSKALHLLSVDQMVYEEGAIDQPQEAQQQRAKPDGAIKVNPGALSNPNGPMVQFNRNLDLVQGQVQMLQEAKMALESIGGAAANLPDLPQSVSGRAFLARQRSASRELGPVFEIFAKFRLAIYWHIWGCIKQFWTDEIWLRVTDEEAETGYRFVGLNRQMTRADRLQELLGKGVPLQSALQAAAGQEAPGVLQRVQQQHQMMSQQAIAMGMAPPGGEQHMLQMVMQDPAMSAQVVENQVAEAMVDITIHEAPESAVLEDEEFSKLAELLPTVMQAQPQLGPTLIRMLIKLSAFRDKREIVKEMDKPQDPQQAQLAQEQQQLQLAGAKAGVDVQQTQAQLNAARAAAEQAKAQIAGAKAPSEIGVNQARAMRDAASAGSQSGGFVPGGIR